MRGELSDVVQQAGDAVVPDRGRANSPHVARITQLGARRDDLVVGSAAAEASGDPLGQGSESRDRTVPATLRDGASLPEDVRQAREASRSR